MFRRLQAAPPPSTPAASDRGDPLAGGGSSRNLGDGGNTQYSGAGVKPALAGASVAKKAGRKKLINPSAIFSQHSSSAGSASSSSLSLSSTSSVSSASAAFKQLNISLPSPTSNISSGLPGPGSPSASSFFQLPGGQGTPVESMFKRLNLADTITMPPSTTSRKTNASGETIPSQTPSQPSPSNLSAYTHTQHSNSSKGSIPHTTTPSTSSIPSPSPAQPSVDFSSLNNPPPPHPHPPSNPTTSFGLPYPSTPQTSNALTNIFSPRLVMLMVQLNWPVPGFTVPDLPQEFVSQRTTEVLKAYPKFAEAVNEYLDGIVGKAIEGEPRAMAIWGVVLQTGSLGVPRDLGVGLKWLMAAASAKVEFGDEPGEQEKDGGEDKSKDASSLSSSTTAVNESEAGTGRTSSEATAQSPSSLSLSSMTPTNIATSIDYSSLSPPKPTASIPAPYLGPITYLIGDAYRRGIGIIPNLNTAFRYLRKSAQSGYHVGYLGLASMYERGDGIIKDDHMAFNMYLKAAERGSVFAMYKIGLCYERGKGVSCDFSKAKEWYKRAVVGSAFSQASMAKKNEELLNAGGKSSVGQAKSQAPGGRRYNLHFPSSVRLAILSLDTAYERFEILEEAVAKYKTPKALHDLAVARSSTRHGAIPNAEEVMDLYEQAAREGHLKSQLLLAKAYSDAASSGYLTPDDSAECAKKAFYWYHAAAVKGSVAAQWTVSGFCRTGTGVAKNVAMAEMWQRAANRCGYEKCVKEFVQDPGMITCYSLTDGKGPEWNNADAEKPFNVITPALSTMDPRILGLSAPGAGSRGTGCYSPPLFFKAGSNSAGHGLSMAPISPNSVFSMGSSQQQQQQSPSSNQATATSSATSAQTPIGVDAAEQDALVDPESLDPVCEGYRNLQQLLNSMNLYPTISVGANPTSTVATYVPLQDRSRIAPSLEVLLRHQATHPKTIIKLLRIKREFLHAEALATQGRDMEAVKWLARGFRSNLGSCLFDHGCYNLRLMFAVSVQRILAVAEVAIAMKRAYDEEVVADAMLVDAFLNMWTRPPEVGLVYCDRLLDARRVALIKKAALIAVANHRKDSASGTSGTAGTESRNSSNTIANSNNNSQQKSAPAKNGKEQKSAESIEQPPSPPALPKNDPTGFLLKGGYLAKLGMWRLAVMAYSKAVDIEETLDFRMPECYFQRGVCYSNLSGTMMKELSIKDLTRYLTLVEFDDMRVPDAHYTIAGNYHALKNVKMMVDHFAKGLEAEAARLPFFPPIVNTELKAKLTLEVKYVLVSGSNDVRSGQWSSVDAKTLRFLDGDENASIARQCYGCKAVAQIVRLHIGFVDIRKIAELERL
ncbi:hypothetical protein HDV05_003331 [Chytridiales sp. JEL 0842]|nr:hypothetical protein HDV05_003331 [Chytridiales sp. JEL 0842]